jgi:hypothetical protein
VSKLGVAYGTRYINNDICSRTIAFQRQLNYNETSFATCPVSSASASSNLSNFCSLSCREAPMKKSRPLIGLLAGRKGAKLRTPHNFDSPSSSSEHASIPNAETGTVNVFLPEPSYFRVSIFIAHTLYMN